MKISEKSKIQMPYNKRTQNKADKGDGKQQVLIILKETRTGTRTNVTGNKRMKGERVERTHTHTHTNRDRGLERGKVHTRISFSEIDYNRTHMMPTHSFFFSSIGHAVTGSSD